MAEGLRRAALACIAPERLPALGSELLRHGLSALPFENVASVSGYSNAAQPARAGEQFRMRVAVARPEHATRLVELWRAGDQIGVGAELGFPACCREFFQAVWVEARQGDTTWAMATGARGRELPERDEPIEVRGPVHANILGRWAAVRLVPHLPCAFDCEPSASFGRELEALARALGHGREMDHALEFLELPMIWSAADGVARIEYGDLLHIEASTDPAPRRRAVRRRGSAGATSRPAAREAEPRPRRAAPPAPDAAELATRSSWFLANGFESREVMDDCHGPILEYVLERLSGRAAPTVLDLGCGNGALLRKLADERPDARVYGVELERERLSDVELMHPGAAHRFYVGDLSTLEAPWLAGRRYSVALLMPGRLLEVPRARAERLRERLARQVEHLVVYAYGHWLSDFPGGLRELTERAGLIPEFPSSRARVGSAHCRGARTPASKETPCPSRSAPSA